MIKVMIATLISLMSFAPIMAQNIKGKIENTKGKPLAFVNVVLLTRGDSAFVKGAVSGEDGSFVIDSPCNDGIIKVSSIGYTTVFRDCRGEDMGVIRLSEDSWMLGEIVVRSQLPKTVLSGEGMTTTVSGSVLEKTANMEQLLSRIPSVSAKDGDIEVFGRGTPVIYINGRKMQDQMELQRLQPTDIKNIEVISNPGARYDASVKSVIRITTKKPQGEGFSFDNSTSFVINEDKRMSYYESFRGNYRKGGFDITGFLYGAYTHQPDNKRIQQCTYTSNTWLQNTEITQEYINLNPYARLNASYMFDDENSIGVSFSYDRYARKEGRGLQQAISYCNDQLVETISLLAIPRNILPMPIM